MIGDQLTSLRANRLLHISQVKRRSMCFPREYVDSRQTCSKSDIKTALPPKYSKIRRRLYYRAKRENRRTKKGSTTSTTLSRPSHLANFEYPNDLPLPRITQKGILQTGNYLRINKAPGPDQIPYEVLKVIMPEISGHLEQIFNDSLSIGYYPAHFNEPIIIILRKQGGTRDFTSPKSYRPISLLNAVGKIMEAVLAARISSMATTHNLLPKMHCGYHYGDDITSINAYAL